MESVVKRKHIALYADEELEEIVYDVAHAKRVTVSSALAHIVRFYRDSHATDRVTETGAPPKPKYFKTQRFDFDPWPPTECPLCGAEDDNKKGYSYLGLSLECLACGMIMECKEDPDGKEWAELRLLPRGTSA